MSMMSIARFQQNLRRLTDDRGFEFFTFLGILKDVFHIRGGASDHVSEDNDYDGGGGRDDDADYEE